VRKQKRESPTLKENLSGKNPKIMSKNPLGVESSTPGVDDFRILHRLKPLPIKAYSPLM